MFRRQRVGIIILLIPVFAIFGYMAVGGVLYFGQDALVFAAARQPVPQMEARARAEGFEPWFNAAGMPIGWQSVDGDPQEVLLVFHGNGGHALMDTVFHRICRKHAQNWKLFLMEYPGYGNREGEPSEESLTRAGVEAVDLLASQPGRRIRLLGYSLGSGVACATVRERPGKIAALFLLTPFNSLVETAAFHYPWVPVSSFLKTRFDSEKNLAGYPGPVCFIVATKDTVVPAVLGQKLYDGYAGRKRLWIEPERDHDATGVLDAEWTEIVGWMGLD